MKKEKFQVKKSPWSDNPSAPENFYESKEIEFSEIDDISEEIIEEDNSALIEDVIEEPKKIQEDIKPVVNDPYAEILKDL